MKMSTMWVALSGVAITAALAGFYGLRSGAGDAGALLRPNDAQLVTRGAVVYTTHCAACHGAQLQGQPEWRTRGADGLLPAPPHDASGHTWHHPDETLFRITKYGVASIIGDPTYKSAMPIYEGILSDNEIVAVLSWIKAQWPAAVRNKHDAFNAAQATKATGNR